jgi:hypothetical protein
MVMVMVNGYLVWFFSFSSYGSFLLSDVYDSQKWSFSLSKFGPVL